MRFWDSSALVPLVCAEESTARCTKILRRDPGLLVWALTPVEIHSAMVRKRRAREIGVGELRDSRRRLHDLSRAWREVLSIERVVARAIRVLDLHQVRAGDALQLAAALVACGDEPGRLPFVILDERLAEAAEREGFPVIIP